MIFFESEESWNAFFFNFKGVGGTLDTFIFFTSLFPRFLAKISVWIAPHSEYFQPAPKMVLKNISINRSKYLKTRIDTMRQSSVFLKAVFGTTDTETHFFQLKSLT